MGFELIPILSGFSSLIILIQPRQTQGWRFVAVMILGLLAIGWLIPTLDILLTIASIIWAIFLVLPVQGFAQVERLVSQEKFQQAANMMELTRWLHPFDGWWDYPDLLRGLALAQAGQLNAAEKIFQQHQTGQNQVERLATILLYRLNGNWSSFAHWVQQQPPTSPARTDPNVQLMYLRALGEMGQINELLDAFQQFAPILTRSNNGIFLNTARLYAFAFSGQTESLTWLLEQNLRQMPADTKQFWQATALWKSGQARPGKAVFRTLQKLPPLVCKPRSRIDSPHRPAMSSAS